MNSPFSADHNVELCWGTGAMPLYIKYDVSGHIITWCEECQCWITTTNVNEIPEH